MQKNILTDLSVMKQELDELGSYIVKEHLKRKFPLFVIGSGISMDLKIPDDLRDKLPEKISIPAMNRIIEKLYSLYNTHEKLIPEQDKEVLRKRFEMWKQQMKEYRKVDRSIVGGILGDFQEKEYLKEAWIEFNNWLLHKCVDENLEIGIIKAPSSTAHEKIAGLYEKVDAFCLTTNFDGLFYKALQLKYSNKNAFSYYTKDVERFFVDETSQSVNRAEIQVRGDIFFVKCDETCKIYKPCEQRITGDIRIWESETEPLKCSKGEYRKPSISFPGTYEKDKEIRKILGALWKFLNYRVSCIITIGIGGWWDPILVAFLSDLVRERDIPFIDVNISPEDSYIVKEIVKPDTSDKRLAFKISANEFMDIFNQSIEQALENAQQLPTISIKYPREEVADDRFWTAILKDWKMNWGMSDFEKELMEHPLVAITSRFAQLGLKSKWLGISDHIRWQHNRLNHSKGVMKIATYLYEKACENSERPEREKEKQFLRIAALLHDIGHLPFSHLIEEVFQELNWKPIGYTESFSHDYYTEEKVRRVFEDSNLKKKLDNIGYSVDDLIKLINGEFGIGFLDAIINGPIDADKIDYVYRDVELTGVLTHPMEPKEFLEEIGRDITINHAELLILKENSAEAAFTILEQRGKLYKEFYLNSGIRLLEKAVKFILITYFVYNYNIPPNEILKKIKNKFLSDEIQIPDLGAVRIAMASEELEKLTEEYKDKDIEMEIVRYMKENLDRKPLDERVRRAIEECFWLIENVDQKNKCIYEGKRKKLNLPYLSLFPPERIDEIRSHAKTVALRFPGVLLIDILPPFEFFKIAGARKRKLRSDGTNVESMGILIPNLQMVKRKEQVKVNVYKIGEKSDVNMAVGLFERLCAEGKRSEEVE